MNAPTATQVRDQRLAAGLTQEQASEIAGISNYQTWSKIERGVVGMSASRWELFLLKIGEHPTHRLVKKTAP